ncbi:hypothetical protein [Streptomyces cahuitamycinicus]|uniref:Uncharacterized protein n=1 Tax=Streptomyces cahuitamycinicus TaxID=2070367 RepID=A0A2N8TWJ3_9ACTN|nr:hypothetical protein [Streptomyces cahuitamycinicus]PNG23392.1 hypothetical protein C1J00_04075 [Streptomyces cahuitamycinicus]
MIELGILFGLFLLTALALICVLLRRQNSRTENADGLLIEQTRRIQAQNDRVTYGRGMGNDYLPTTRDPYRP